MNSPLRIATLLTAGLLAGFYVAVLWLARHPQVSELYRLYYVENRLMFWNHGEGIGYEPGQRITFDSMLSYFGREGWAFPEHWGTWSDGKASELLLRPPADAPLREVVVEGEPFLAPEAGITQQTLSLSVNGRFAGAHTLDSTDPVVLRFPVPEQAWDAGTPLVLRFSYSNPVPLDQPGLVGGETQRAFGFVALTLR